MSDTVSRPLAMLRSSDDITPEHLVRRAYLPDGHDDGEKAINAAWTAWGILSFAGTDDVHGKALRASILTYVLDTAAAQEVHCDVIEPDGRAALDAELFRGVRSIIEALNLPAAAPSTEEEALAEGLDVLPWDEVLAQYLETLGGCGRTHATHLRSASTRRAALPERWRRWVEWCATTNDGVLYRLAMCLWADRVGPRLRTEIDRMPALQSRLHNKLFTAAAPTARIIRSSCQLELFDGGRIDFMAQLDPGVLERAYRGSAALQTPRGIEVILHLIEKCARQTWGHVDQPHMMTWHGGYRALAEELGWAEGGAQTTLRDILLALRHLDFDWGNGAKGGLIGMAEPDGSIPSAHRGKRASLTVIAMPPLTPGWVHNKDVEHKQLVPLTRPPPRYIGRPQEKASQMVLWYLLTGAMRAAIKELVDAEGKIRGIPLEEATRSLWEKAGIRDVGRWRDVMNLWVDETGPAPLELVCRVERRVIVADPRAKAFLLKSASGAHEKGPLVAREKVRARIAREKASGRGKGRTKT